MYQKEIEMSSREQILASIKANKPSLIELSKINKELFVSDIDLQAQFKKMVEGLGGNLGALDSRDEFISNLIKLFPTANKNYSYVIEASGFNSIDISEIQRPHELEERLMP